MPTPSNNSNWIDDSKLAEKNNFWLYKSKRIALKTLMHIKKMGISQRDLAEKLEMKPQQINKIIKGGSNLTLETICKIERELGIEFVVIPESKTMYNMDSVMNNILDRSAWVVNFTNISGVNQTALNTTEAKKQIEMEIDEMAEPSGYNFLAA